MVMLGNSFCQTPAVSSHLVLEAATGPRLLRPSSNAFCHPCHQSAPWPASFKVLQCSSMCPPGRFFACRVCVANESRMRLENVASQDTGQHKRCPRHVHEFKCNMHQRMQRVPCQVVRKPAIGPMENRNTPNERRSCPQGTSSRKVKLLWARIDVHTSSDDTARGRKPRTSQQCEPFTCRLSRQTETVEWA